MEDDIEEIYEMDNKTKHIMALVYMFSLGLFVGIVICIAVSSIPS